MNWLVDMTITLLVCGIGTGIQKGLVYSFHKIFRGRRK